MVKDRSWMDGVGEETEIKHDELNIAVVVNSADENHDACEIWIPIAID